MVDKGFGHPCRCNRPITQELNNFAGVAQLVRAPVLHTGCRRFKSVSRYHLKRVFMKTKQCSKCKRTKSYLDDFSKNGKSTRSICKECENGRQQEIHKKSVEFFHTLKGKCCICGYNKNPTALEFHHTDSNKENHVSRIARLHFSEKRKLELLVEIKKCILVCSNCHREIHNPEYNRTDF